MEWTNILKESLTMGNFVDINTFVDDEGNPIPLIKSEFPTDFGDEEGSSNSDRKGTGEDGTDDATSNSDSDDDSEDGEDGQPVNGKSSNSNRNQNNNNSNQNNNSDNNSDNNSGDNSDNNSNNSNGNNGSDDGSNNDSNDDLNDKFGANKDKKPEDDNEDDNESDSQNKSNSNSSGKSSNKNQNQKPDPSVFDNPPKIVDMNGAKPSEDDGLQYDMENKPLMYGAPDMKSQGKTQKQGQKKKIAPNPNKVYVDTKTGKSYKFDYNQNKFVQVYIGNGN